MKKSRVRVRFAPSPTGPLHMGGIRTALYNYLFAKKNGGDFLLRIEDTDQSRFVSGAEKYIVDSLKWCGIFPDEGVGAENLLLNGGPNSPYRQSERKDIYLPYVDKLLNSENAYLAFDTPDELIEVRERSKNAGNPNWQYNGITRNSMKNSLTLTKKDVEDRIKAGQPHVVRVKMPRNEEIKFNDQIRGWVSVNSMNVDDKVLLKGDGLPTYHLANVIDDYLMKITHVIRGEEWLPSAPLHVLLYDYFGWDRPCFAHLPLLLRPDGNGKLSKRDGDRLGFPVFPINWQNPETNESALGYKEAGFYPQSFINMLAFLGWNPGDNKEIFTMNELISAFSLEKVSKSGARFDFEKAKWFNQQHLRLVPKEILIEQYICLLKTSNKPTPKKPWAEKALYLFMDRAEFIGDVISESSYLFEDPLVYDKKMVDKKWSSGASSYIKSLADSFARTDYTEENLELAFKAYLDSSSLSFGRVGPVLRLAIAGTTQGPSIFTVMELIGQAASERRIANAVSVLG